MTKAPSWMLYGAAGFTGTLIAQHAHARGHRPLLAGRSAPGVTALAEKLDLPHQTLTLDDPDTLRAALADVDLVLNAAGPFLHTATPLAEACLDAEAHYLDISNELQVFRALYDLDERARQADIVIIPGVGFGVVATNCLARYVSEVVGGAEHLEVAALAATTQPGPGVAATREQNIPFGGWIRRDGQLHPYELGEGITTITLPDWPAQVMPVPTGDLEAAFEAAAAPNITAYTVLRTAAAVDPTGSGQDGVGPQTYQSFGWARAAGPDGAAAEAWLQTGDSYVFTAEASIRAVEEAFAGSRRGACGPATAFDPDFAFTIPNTTRIDTVPVR
ncbi:MAG: saccharopine dehydrogenase NADP-binding domain-containing protein [Acidimicrobiia bacterium]